MKNKLLAIVLSCLSIFIECAHADKLNIAVASNFSQTAKQLANKFQQQTGSVVIISTGATGVLSSQIKNGAPYAILLAADEITPQYLIHDGYALESSCFTYATGQLVLWSSQKSLVDPKGRVLFSEKFNHLAIANPKLAPYGLAAATVIAKLGLTAKLQSKIIQGANINDTYQYVASGNAELGFVALSQVYHHGKLSSGSAWVVPAELFSAIKQDAVLTSVGAQDKLAQKFMLFLKSSVAKKIILEYGYK